MKGIPMQFLSRRTFAAIAVLGALSTGAYAQENGTRDEAKAMVDAAV
jgi:hypothetical protein